MFKKILSTTATRITTALISLWVLYLNASQLGPEGIGIIGIIVLDISIISLVNGLLGSSTLSYYVSRKPMKQLLLTSFLSIAAGTLLLLATAWVLSFFPEAYYRVFMDGYLEHILVLSILQSLYANNMAILIGKEEIFKHNLITLSQFISLLGAILYLYGQGTTPVVMDYLNAYYLSIIIPLALSSILILSWLRKEKVSTKPKGLIKEVFNYGWAVQLASLVQMLNYRIPYYFLNAPQGKQNLGVYTTSNQLAEGLWIFGKSVSLVQYARIANSKDMDYNKELSLRLLKFTSLITALALLVVMLIPGELFQLILKHEAYGQIPGIIMLLAPGVLALVAKMILAHYFAGTGRPRINLYASAISLVFAILSASILIPAMGIEGAAIAASITYLTGALILLLLFIRESSYGISDFFLNKKDLNFLRAFIQEFRN